LPLRSRRLCIEEKDPASVSEVDRLRPRRDEDELQTVERDPAVAALRDAVGEGRLALAVGGRCVEGAGASPVAVAGHELLDLQLPLRLGHRDLGANGRAASRCFLSRVHQLEYPDVRSRRRTLLALEDDATRGTSTRFEVPCRYRSL